VILLHGFPQDWYEFRQIMPRLAKKFTVVAVDLRGIGGSEATARGYDAANMAEDIHQLTEQLQLKPVMSSVTILAGWWPMPSFAVIRKSHAGR